MDIINLVLTVCLLGSPSSCREETLRFENTGGALNCMFLAPSQIAKWSDEHPAYRVAKWRCAYPDKRLSI